MKSCKRQAVSRVIGAFFGLASTQSLATDNAEGTGLPLWELGIGAAAYHQSSHPGSDVRSTTGFPFPYVIYRRDWLRIDRSLQGILYETQRVKLFWQSKRRTMPKNTSPGSELETPLFGL